jgi:hypothetical protein
VELLAYERYLQNTAVQLREAVKPQFAVEVLPLMAQLAAMG